jgi:prophage regulatory protein
MQQNYTKPPIQALRIKDVTSRTRMSRTQVYRLVQADKFPKPHRLSERVSVWDAAAVDSWLNEKFGGAA